MKYKCCVNIIIGDTMNKKYIMTFAVTILQKKGCICAV